jgi:hypothetical protein
LDEEGSMHCCHPQCSGGCDGPGPSGCYVS